MPAPTPQRLHTSPPLSLFIRRTLLLLLTLSLLTTPLAAQTEQEMKQAAAQNLINEGRQLFAHSSQDALQRAIRKFEEVRLLFHAVNNAAGEATALTTMGMIYERLADGQKAIECYMQASLRYRAAQNREAEAATYVEIGLIYKRMGEPQRALDNYARGLRLFQAAGSGKGTAATLQGMGTIYSDLGEQQQARDYYTRALSLFLTLAEHNRTAEVLLSIGALYLALLEPQKAAEYYTQAWPLLRAAGDDNGAGAALISLGLLYVGIGEKQQALDNFSQARRLFRAGHNQQGEAMALAGIGKLYSDAGQPPQALTHFTQALSLIRTIGDRPAEAYVLGLMALTERTRGNLLEARADMEDVLIMIESLRTKIINQELRTSYFTTMQDYYDFHIETLMQLHKQRPAEGYSGAALQTSERARARSLLELLTEAGADIRQGVDAELLGRERALQQRLDASRQQRIRLLSGAYSAEHDALAKEIDSLTTEYEQVEAQIRQKSPHYAALTQPVPLTLAQIQTQVLDKDTLLLEYALGAERSYLWAVTPDAITSYELPKRAEIKAAAREFYNLTAKPPQRAASDAPGQRDLSSTLRQEEAAKLAQAAAQLSRMLLAPVAPLLGRKRLLVVVVGALQAIPFAALPVPTGDASTAAAPPLVVEHEIVNLPSVSTLAVLRRETGGRTAASKTLAVLADPVFESSDGRLKVLAARPGSGKSEPAARTGRLRGLGFDRLRFPRLPGTRREADAIVQLAPPAQARAALDFAANRATADELSEYRYVHFATHGGLLDPQHPELFGVVLSQFDQLGTPRDDGFLLAPDVFNLKFAADVVVLSACQTGLGKDVRGEGLMGLTRGFMYAGAPRVVVSLWNVNDAATAELMTRFYRGMLVDKQRPAQALRVAQVSMLKEPRYSAPFYWAAFTLQGEWR